VAPVLDAVDPPGQRLETGVDAGLYRSFRDPLAVVVENVVSAGVDQEARQARDVVEDARRCGQGNILNNIAIAKKK